MNEYLTDMKRVNVGAKNYFKEIYVRDMKAYYNIFYPALYHSDNLIQHNLLIYIQSERMRSYFWIGKTN